MAGKITRPKKPRALDEGANEAGAMRLSAVGAEIRATCETVKVGDKALHDASKKRKDIQTPSLGRTAGS